MHWITSTLQKSAENYWVYGWILAEGYIYIDIKDIFHNFSAFLFLFILLISSSTLIHKKREGIWCIKKTFDEYFIWESVSQYLRFTFFFILKQNFFLWWIWCIERMKDMDVSFVHNIQYLLVVRKNIFRIYRSCSLKAVKHQ